MTKETPPPPPDFRNLGILLRVAVAAQGLAWGAALIQSRGVFDAFGLFVDMAAFLEPPLLTCLLAFYLLSPRLAAWPHRHFVAVGVGLPALLAMLWSAYLIHQYPDLTDPALGGLALLRSALLGGMAGMVLLAWLDWRARRLSPALAEARLQALQARIRPHFLFNSLNSVLSLIRSDPKRAESALENLAELYRTLMADNRQLSTLGKEVELARAYLDLEALRLGDRLAVEWRADNAPGQAQVPALVLQPLLENAVCHGIEPNPGGGRIGVDIFVKDDQLTVVVRNPLGSEGDAPPATGRRGNRMALSNIRERLALHFDAEARLSAHRLGGEFVVQLVMPLRHPPRGPAR